MRAARRRSGFTLMEQISAQLELARQRAIVTGIPHRLAIDLEAGSYWIEWFVTEAEALGEEEETPVLDLRGAGPIPMAPPHTGVREFRPLPGMFGRPNPIDASLSFQGVDTLEGTIDRGEAFVAFERDGTASPMEIVLADDDGHALALEVLPLADAVQIHDVVL